MSLPVRDSVPIQGSQPTLPNEQKIQEAMEYLLEKRIRLSGLIQKIHDDKDYSKQWAGVRRVMYEQPEIVGKMTKENFNALMEAGGWKFVFDHLRGELNSLAKTEPFGAFDPPKSSDLLKDLINENMLREKAPTWMDLINYVGKPKRHDPKRNRPVQLIKQSAFLLSSLCYNNQKKKSNSFALSLGIFMHQCGLTRRGLEVLSALGITASYDTVLGEIRSIADKQRDELSDIGAKPTAIVQYDNLDFADGVREIREGEEPVFYSVTTGLVSKGYGIPEKGLERTWLKPKYELTPHDIWPESPGPIQERSEARKKVLFAFLC